MVDLEEIEKSNFEIVSIRKTDKSKFNMIENSEMKNAIKRKRKKNMKTV